LTAGIACEAPVKASVSPLEIGSTEIRLQYC
jgi:hypothetical protein